MIRPVQEALKMPRKPKLAPHLRIRLDTELLARVEKSRQANHRTLTGEISERLEESFQQELTAQKQLGLASLLLGGDDNARLLLLIGSAVHYTIGDWRRDPKAAEVLLKAVEFIVTEFENLQLPDPPIKVPAGHQVILRKLMEFIDAEQGRVYAPRVYAPREEK
jgi:hypothetical protein